MTVQEHRAIIIGAGIGGLCAAIGLRQVGIEADVYEQAAAFGDAGAGLTLWANAIRGLRSLGIPEEALRGARVRWSTILEQGGQVLSGLRVEELETELGAPSLAAHRADVHQALLAALPAGTVHTSMVCTGFTQDESGVTARFADGGTARGDLLVGADGIHSVVRGQLFPEVVLRYAGYPAWRGVTAGDAFARIDRTSETWGRGARFGIVPIGGKRIYWFATGNLPAGVRRDPAEHKADLLRRFRGWHAPIEELIEATPEDKILYNDIFDFPPLQHWSQGRVTLLGDAAHPTTPNLGQGACQAIESSIVLARSLAEAADLPAALLRYERERHPRTAWITNTSWQLGKVAQLENAWVCGLRDMVMRLAPPAAMRGQIVKAAGHAV